MGIRGKHGEMEVLRHIKRILISMDHSNECNCKYLESLEDKVGFKFFLKGMEYEIHRPKRAKTDSDDLVISGVGNDYIAMIQIKNIVSRAVTLTHVRSFIEKLIEEDVDDGLFISLSSPVRGDLLNLFNVDFSPRNPDDYWENGIKLFLKNKVGTQSIKNSRKEVEYFHQEVNTFLKKKSFRFRDFPTDFSKRLPWLLGFRVPSKKGVSIHFSPSALFHHENKRYLFFIVPKDLRMDIIRSWRLQQLLLDAKELFLGVPPDHPFTIGKKHRRIKQRINIYGWRTVFLESENITFSPTLYSIKDLSNFRFFDDNLKYSDISPLKEIKFSFSCLPPCIQNAYSQGVSDGRYHTTLLLSVIKDLVKIEENDKKFFNHFSNICFDAANKAMLAKKKDSKIELTRRTRYFPIKRKLGLLQNLPCNHDGGIWMGPQTIDRIYYQKLCQPDERCERMGNNRDVINYLKLVQK